MWKCKSVRIGRGTIACKVCVANDMEMLGMQPDWQYSRIIM